MLPHILSMVYIIILVVMTIRMNKYTITGEIFALIYIVLICVIATALETVFIEFRFLLTGAMIASCAIYYIVLYVEAYMNAQLANKEAELIRKEAELAENRISLMLSQIQPHFIYNTLGTIGMLCEKDPKLASQATDRFAKYLRVNLNGIKRIAPVPLSNELEHVKTYLWLEQMRFGEDLEVEYDIETEAFFIPILSIQTMVENAVVHGFMGREGKCTIKIQTKEQETHYEVIISDNGVGFELNKEKDDGRSHIGIENVKERLDYMMNGTLHIESHENVGTKVFIQIPKEKTL